MQPVMFSLEAPDIKRGIAALKYIKIINNLLRPLESPMAAKKEPHKTLAVLREARCARSLLHITRSKNTSPGTDLRGMHDGWMNVYQLDIQISLCHSRLAVSFAIFKKYATESLQGCEGAKYVYDLDIQTTTSNHLSRYGEFLVTVHEGGYAKTSGRLNQRLF